MWQELCKTRKEYLERAKLDTKGYSPRRSETLLYEIARLDGMDIKKQDFFNILNDIEISPKVTREDTHRIKDLSNAFLYLVKCAQQRKRLSLDFVREVSAKVMQHTGKEVYTTIGGYDTSLGDFRLGEEYYEELVQPGRQADIGRIHVHGCDQRSDLGESASGNCVRTGRCLCGHHRFRGTFRFVQ